MDSKQKGSLGEHAVICDLLSRQHHVSMPVGDYLPYDLIADINGELLKVQVKSATENNNVCKIYNKKSKVVQGTWQTVKYKHNSYDLLALYNLTRGIVVYVPHDIIIDKVEYTIRFNDLTQSKSF